jgi:hypothetical protein
MMMPGGPPGGMMGGKGGMGGMGGQMGEMMGMTKDMEMGDKMNFMAAMGLQGFLMMDSKALGKHGDLPKIAREIPACFKQILWTPEEKSRGFICSRLSKDLKEKIRALMMMVLKMDIPTAVFAMDWDFDKYEDIIDDSDIEKELQRIAMPKLMTPIESDDIKELIGPIKKLYNKILDSEPNGDKKAIIKIIGGLIEAVQKDQVYENLADIARDIQGSHILTKNKTKNIFF